MIFVGRQPELERFGQVLASPQGQAVLVVGQEGMGKTMLLNRMAQLAGEHPDLTCGVVRYEVTPTDSVDSILALMLDHAYETARIEEGSFSGTRRRLEQWRAFLNVFKLGDLVFSFRRDPERNTRDQFLRCLEDVSGHMPEDGRAVFIVDPEKYMAPDSDQAWAIVIGDLPPKVKLVFAQRPEDVLARSPHLNRCQNVVCVPEEKLSVLDDASVEEMLTLRAPGLTPPLSRLRTALARYQGHPYAVAAALDLIEAGTPVDGLPADTTGIARAQWARVCEHSPQAMKLLKAHAVLEVPVPDEVAIAVSELEADVHPHLLADGYLRGLFREEAGWWRIYHALLADHVRGELPRDEATVYHRRAIGVYRERLTREEKPDELAALRLPEHVLAAEGEAAFVLAFGNESGPALASLGLVDASLDGLQRTLRLVPRGSLDHAAALGNLGSVYQTRGDLEEAERMHRDALAIEQRLGRLEGIANNWASLGLICLLRGDFDEAERMLGLSLEMNERLARPHAVAAACGNLGAVYRTRGDLEEAERMHRKSLQINERLGRLEGMGKQYGNLGLIYSTRGDLEEAERMFAKSLDLHRRLGHREGLAADYTNLGLIYQARGDPDEAERMYRKSLDVFERLGGLGGMASNYGNLGVVYAERGDLEEAEGMFRRALEIEERLARMDGLARQYGNLGVVYRERGDLKEAECMLRKSLGIFQRIGHLEGLADQYDSLAVLCRTRGDLAEAERLHRQSLEIDERLGRQEGMANAYTGLGVVCKQRNDPAGAREFFTKARDIYARIGMKHMVEKAEGLLRDLGDAAEDDEAGTGHAQ